MKKVAFDSKHWQVDVPGKPEPLDFDLLTMIEEEYDKASVFVPDFFSRNFQINPGGFGKAFKKIKASGIKNNAQSFLRLAYYFYAIHELAKPLLCRVSPSKFNSAQQNLFRILAFANMSLSLALVRISKRGCSEIFRTIPKWSNHIDWPRSCQGSLSVSRLIFLLNENDLAAHLPLPAEDAFDSIDLISRHPDVPGWVCWQVKTTNHFTKLLFAPGLESPKGESMDRFIRGFDRFRKRYKGTFMPAYIEIGKKDFDPRALNCRAASEFELRRLLGKTSELLQAV